MAKVICPHCKKTSHAPEAIAGRRVQCPACNAVLTAPAVNPAATNDAAQGDQLAALAELMEAELGANPRPAPPLLPAALREPQPRATSNRGVAPWLMRSKLLLAVIVVACFVSIGSWVYLNSAAGVFNLLGVLVAALDWRSRRLNERQADDPWRGFENGLGIFLAYLPFGLVLLIAIGVLVPAFTFGFAAGASNGWRPTDVGAFVGFGIVMLFGVAMVFGLSYALRAVFNRFGVYRVLSCGYLLQSGILLAAIVLLHQDSAPDEDVASLDQATKSAWTEVAPRSAQPDTAVEPQSAASPSSIGIPAPPRPALPRDAGAKSPDIARPAPSAVTSEKSRAHVAENVVARSGPPVRSGIDPTSPEPADHPANLGAVRDDIAAAERATPAPPPVIPLSATDPPLQTKPAHVLSSVGGVKRIHPTGKPVEPGAKLSPGTAVQVELDHRWYAGKVVEVVSKDFVRIAWIEGPRNSNDVVPRSRLRLDLVTEDDVESPAPLAIAEVTRNWVDEDGNVVSGKYLSCNGSYLKLRFPAGNEGMLPVSKLSVSDKELVREIMKAKGES